MTILIIKRLSNPLSRQTNQQIKQGGNKKYLFVHSIQFRVVEYRVRISNTLDHSVCLQTQMGDDQ